jgi:MoxR-like ATPase
VRLVRGEDSPPQADAPAPPPKIPQQVVFDARTEISAVTTKDMVVTYIVALIAATRRPAEYGDKLKTWIAVGASPRGSLALDKCSRALAWLRGRNYVTPEDVQAVAHDCLRHRISLTYQAAADGIGKDEVVDEVIRQVAVPA